MATLRTGPTALQVATLVEVAKLDGARTWQVAEALHISTRAARERLTRLKAHGFLTARLVYLPQASVREKLWELTDAGYEAVGTWP